jgi:hypothetical protein
VAIGSGRYSVSEGAEIVEACLDAGINYIDCASTYGDAEQKVGAVMKRRRAEVVLATKTLERDVEASWREINRSLDRLQTSFVDLLQIHAVNRMEELDRVTARDGALAAVLRAQEEGLCRHIGITGHTRPEVLVEAFRRFPFATALVPLSSMDALISDFGEALFPLSRERGFGVIAMKVLAGGSMTRYAAESLRYALSLPVGTAVVGMGSREEVRQNASVAASFRPLTVDERRALVEKTRPHATTAILWWKRR